GPGGIALLDHSTFDVLRAWENDRGDQYLAYDAWWHLNQNTLISSEWGTPSMIEDGLVPELLLGQKYGHRLHFWDLAEGRNLQTALQPFGAVPPLVTDIDLSVDDRMLYVSCWGTGELKQYDVSDPANPREVGSVHLGGVARRTPHPAAPELPLAGGPQMVEI